METTVNLPESRMSFMDLYIPKEDMNGTLKYSVTLLIPKTTNVDNIRAIIRHIFEQEQSKKLRGISFDMMFNCLQDGDIYAAQKPEKRQAYVGNWYINASKLPSNGKPTVLNEQGLPSDGPSTFDAGDYGIPRVSFFAFAAKNKQGHVIKQGISAEILGVKKTRDGERFRGGESENATAAALGGLATGYDTPNSLDSIM